MAGGNFTRGSRIPSRALALSQIPPATQAILQAIKAPGICTQVGDKWKGGSKIDHFLEGVHPGNSLAWVVRKVDIVIHEINHYPAIPWFVLLALIHWKASDPVDNVIQPSNNLGLLFQILSRMHTDLLKL